MDDHFLTTQELTFNEVTPDATTDVALPTQPATSGTVADTTSNGSTGPKIIYLDRVCRTCLSEKQKDHLKDLFEFGLAETVMSCVSITLEESDGLPCHICMECLQEVERIINFRQLCERSDASIRNLIEKSVVINQDSQTKYEVLNVILTDANGNTETSAVVVPIEELRFQLVNGGQASTTTQQSINFPTAELTEPDELPALPIISEVHSKEIHVTVPSEGLQLNFSEPSDMLVAEEITVEPQQSEETMESTVNPNDLLNEEVPSLALEPQTKEEQQQQESTILLNLKQELSEFIGGTCTDIPKDLDDNDDDEMIHVDYLKDALTEEYIQIMEKQLASSVPPLQDRLEHENLDCLINDDQLIQAEATATLANWSEVPEEPKTSSTEDTGHEMLENADDGVTKHGSIDDVFENETHLNQYSEELFNCKHCSQQFIDKNHYNAHVRNHSKIRPHSCETCGKRFGTKSLLNTHNKSHLGEKTHICPVCSKGFTLPWQLKAHSRIHTNEKPYECPYCQKRFNQNGNLMIHIRIHTGERPFQCSLCEKAYHSQGELNGHMRQHTGEKKVKNVTCTVCEKAFAGKGDLKIHMRTHTKERPYGCQLCGKTFMLHVHLTVHMRSHTGEKPFACTICEKAFPTNHQLKNHSYVHTGEKNYACDVCNRRFSSSANRNTHRKTHDRKIS